MRYVSVEEARSDLFLSVAVYLLGPLVVGLLLQIIPLGRIRGVDVVLRIGLPLVYTVLVPYLLIRYRRESLRDYGSTGGSRAFALGVLLAAPIVVATLLATLLERNPLERALPVLLVDQAGGAVVVAERLASWLGLAAFAVYATVKARDAFRSDPRRLREGAIEIGRVLAIVAAVTVLLLLLVVSGRLAEFLLTPLGVAGAVVLALRWLRAPSATSRATLLTPVILLALPFLFLTLNASAFVLGIYFAALLAAVGLLIGMLQEARYSVYGALGLALALALASPLPLAVRG